MIGDIKLLAVQRGQHIPEGYLPCDGSLIPVVYSELRELIGPRVPDLSEVVQSVKAHLEPEGPEAKGIHEKVVVQVGSAEGVVYVIQAIPDSQPTSFSPQQEARIRDIVREMIPNT